VFQLPADIDSQIELDLRTQTLPVRQGLVTLDQVSGSMSALACFMTE
jgi:hypothetical protein